MMGPDYGFTHWSGGLGDPFVFIVLILLFKGLLIAGAVLLVVWAVRASGRHGTPSTPALPVDAPGAHDEAVAIARRRLAGGEITPEQYEEIVRVLRA